MAATLLTGCSGDEQAGNAAQGEGQAATQATPSSSTASATPSSSTASATPSSTSQRSTPSRSSSGTQSSASPDGTGGDATDPPIVVGTSSAPRTLTLGDFFVNEGWEEGEVKVPRQQEPVQALTTEVVPKSSGYTCEQLSRNSKLPAAPPLELRLAAESGTITFTVSQALASATSDTLLDVTLLADNRTVETTTAPFEESRTLSVAVDGVSSVKLQIAVSGDSPSCSTTAVVRDVQLTSS